MRSWKLFIPPTRMGCSYVMLGATLSGPVAGMSAAVYRDPTYRDSPLAHMNEKYFYMKNRDVARSRQNGPARLPGWLTFIWRGLENLWRYLKNLEIFSNKMAVSRYLGHFIVIWTEFPTFVFVNCYIYTFVIFHFKRSITNGWQIWPPWLQQHCEFFLKSTQFVLIPDVHIRQASRLKNFSF